MSDLTPEMQALKKQGEYDVMKKIIDVLMPQMCCVIDDLLDYATNAPTELTIRAKKFLPDYWPHSLQQSPIVGKKKK